MLKNLLDPFVQKSNRPVVQVNYLRIDLRHPRPFQILIKSGLHGRVRVGKIKSDQLGRNLTSRPVAPDCDDFQHFSTCYKSFLGLSGR